MLGHHDDTVYGIGWEGEEGRSDVKSVCGDYPAVISFDLGELELGNAANLDGGSSSMLVYNGEVQNVCASLYGSRPLPTAFIVTQPLDDGGN